MALTPARKKANEKYLATHYTRLNIRYPIEYIEKVKAAATASGESIAGYVKAAIDKRMHEEGLEDKSRKE